MPSSYFYSYHMVQASAQVKCSGWEPDSTNPPLITGGAVQASPTRPDEQGYEGH